MHEGCRIVTVDYGAGLTHLRALSPVALITTGRTGSDFLQSLLDGHPQVATFNGHFAVYSEFFNIARTFKVDGASISDATDEFIGCYLYKLVSRYDIQEAKDALGKDGKQSFTINTAVFKSHLIGLMGSNPLNTRDFLLSIYGAYNLCLGQSLEQLKIFFHHPHLDYEFLSFFKDFPNSRIVFTSRDPRANFCSHVEHFSAYYPSHDNEQHIFNCLDMLLKHTELGENLGLDYTVTRLEDLPRDVVMRELALWLNIEYRDSLLRSTWGGLDWHGDRISAKRFSATGWSKNRTENNWKTRLGWSEKYILNYLLYDRLRWFKYAASPRKKLDMFIVPLLILLPFRVERRLLNPRKILAIVKNGTLVMRLQLFLFPIFYFKRVKLCYKYYYKVLVNYSCDKQWIGQKLNAEEEL
jgi:hypothetical protein